MLILKYMGKRDAFLMAVCLILIAGGVYFDLRIPEYMSQMTDSLQSGSDTDEVVSIGWRMAGCAVASLVLSISTVICSSRAAASFCRTLRSKLFKSIGGFSKQDIDQFSPASLVTRSTNDINQVQDFFSSGVQILFKAPIMAVWAIAKIWGSAWEWTVATAIAMAVLAAVFALIIRAGLPFIRRMQVLVDAVNRITRESVMNAKGVRAYGAEERQEKLLGKASDDLLDNSVTLVHIMSPLHAFSSSMLNFLTLAIYWIGAGLIDAAAGQTEQMHLFSDMIVFTSYAAYVITSVMSAADFIRMLPRVMVSARRISEVIEHEPSIKEGSLSDVPESGEIEFRDVSFRYPGAKEDAVSHISFKVKKGQTVAIVGPTASGKSTALSLIPRLYDATSGSVLVDGRDVREYTFSELAKRIGYIPQTPVIFGGTVRDNVNYGGGSEMRCASDVERALRISQLWDFVSGLPEGVDYSLSQHGRNLSGGQAQRLSIARTVCRSPETYLFDDTFSALDYRTDRDLRAALGKETAGSTKIIVAQRISTIADADRIIVFDEGKVVGNGTHSELMESCSLYREIAETELESE